jgi:hypothetical protein
MGSNPISGSSLMGITEKDRIDLQIEFLRDIVNRKVSLRVPLYCSNYRMHWLIASTNSCFR